MRENYLEQMGKVGARVSIIGENETSVLQSIVGKIRKQRGRRCWLRESKES